jgi:putative ABC transport system permease protein
MGRLVAGLNVVIIDEEFARRYWPNEDPIGKRIRMPWESILGQRPALTVVGVVARVKQERLSERGGIVQAYMPALQGTIPGMAVVMKTTLEPKTLIASARRQVLALDPEQPISDVRTLTELRDNSLAAERLNLTLLTIFAAVALLLAAIGLYGVISYAATQRTQEIGIRMALGASRGAVLKLVVGQGMTLALIGVAIGLAASFALTRQVKTLLFDVSATDPLTFGAVAALMTLVALLACFVPARRATKVDPLVALRRE